MKILAQDSQEKVSCGLLAKLAQPYLSSYAFKVRNVNPLEHSF